MSQNPLSKIVSLLALITPDMLREAIGADIRFPGETLAESPTAGGARGLGRRYLLTATIDGVPGAYRAIEIDADYDPATASRLAVGTEVTVFDPAGARALTKFTQEMLADPEAFEEKVNTYLTRLAQEGKISIPALRSLGLV